MPEVKQVERKRPAQLETRPYTPTYLHFTDFLISFRSTCFLSGRQFLPDPLMSIVVASNSHFVNFLKIAFNFLDVGGLGLSPYFYEIFKPQNN